MFPSVFLYRFQIQNWFVQKKKPENAVSMAPSPGYTRSLLAIELILETVLEREGEFFRAVRFIDFIGRFSREKSIFFRVKLIT